MVQVNELVDLAQRLDSVLDDSKGEILSANFGRYGVEIHVGLPFFVSKFSHADIAEGVGFLFPYQLQVEVDGILFYALVAPEEMNVLRAYATNEWLQRHCPLAAIADFNGRHEKAHSHGRVNEQLLENI